MSKLFRKENGFGAVEIVMTVVMVVLIGAICWLFYKNVKVPTKPSSGTYFVTLPSIAQNYYFKQAVVLGIKPTASDIVRSCFHQHSSNVKDSNDKVVLTCAVEIHKVVPAVMDIEQAKQTMNTLAMTAHQQGFSQTRGDFVDHTVPAIFINYDGKQATQGCSVEITYSTDLQNAFDASQATSNAYLRGDFNDIISQGAKAGVSYTLNCQKDTSKVPDHYQLMDNDIGG